MTTLELEITAQPLMAHLIELRRRLLHSAIVFLLATGACYFFAANIYGFLTQPLAAAHNGGGAHRLIYTNLTEAFVTYLKVALFAGGVLTVPFILWQIWSFMAPGLYPAERKAVLPFFLCAPILFVLGGLLAFYGVIPAAWDFFVSFETPPQAGNSLPIVLEARVADYLSLTTTMIFAFGLAFQLPIVLGLLGKLGVVKARTLARGRKWAVVAILVFAAVITPTPDMVSQTALAIPLYFLFEMSIWLVRYLEKSPTEPNETKHAGP